MNINYDNINYDYCNYIIYTFHLKTVLIKIFKFEKIYIGGEYFEKK